MPRASLICTVAALLVAGAASPAGALPVETLVQAERIRADIQQGQSSFLVTEASSTGVVHSLTLLSSRLDAPRVVPASGGVYYAICRAGATCPYPGRHGAPVRARLPRRIALELAARTFRTTSASLVVVSLPTRQPVLLVLERSDVPEGSSEPDLDRLTLPHLYAMQALVPISETADTLVLARLSS